ncbi:hypothetical protein FGIG_02307 [Fasciola gigantica]|uniref:Secreted protein n=1 Tax=Fasciola gigantica TaxID=46835 RepID=A0A504YT18_FASGI|nr:hypothetical protein FGIG_02307 [Fasciola gigantica]
MVLSCVFLRLRILFSASQYWIWLPVPLSSGLRQWPNTILSGKFAQLYIRYTSLSAVDSCLTFSDKVVIPASLR